MTDEQETIHAFARSRSNAELAVSRPLPPGSLIEYCGERGTVINDDGGGRIEVACDGHRQNWYWEFEGVSCTVISVTSNA